MEIIGAHTKHELAATIKLSATASPRNMSPYNECNVFIDIDPSTVGHNVHFIIIQKERVKLIGLISKVRCRFSHYPRCFKANHSGTSASCSLSRPHLKVQPGTSCKTNTPLFDIRLNILTSLLHALKSSLSLLTINIIKSISFPSNLIYTYKPKNSTTWPLKHHSNSSPSAQ
jgi:hypothetical protein